MQDKDWARDIIFSSRGRFGNITHVPLVASCTEKLAYLHVFLHLCIFVSIRQDFTGFCTFA